MTGFDLTSLLNEKSKAAEAQENDIQAEEQENEFEIVMLDVEDLMPSRDNFYSTENIEELAVSIELAGGIEQNLVVKPQAHGKYEIIAGHRRRLAALKLVNEGKEEYRKVPCRIKKESDTIKDKLSLIFTNATARQLTDWEKVQQAKELREVLLEYKKALDEENREKPKEDKVRMGRIREIVAQILNTSTTQIGRMEAIDNNLSQDFKHELEKGNINISTAHELSRLDEEKQAKAYQQYEEKGELHIKDVKEEQKPDITDEQVEWVQMALMDAVKGMVNHDIFKVKDNVLLIEKELRKHFAKSFKGTKIELEGGGHFIYRFSADGITLINMAWENYLVVYSDLAEIVALMIENDMLAYDDTPEVEESTETQAGGFVNEPVNEPMAAGETEEEDNEDLPGQQDLSSYADCVPEPAEKGLDFTRWLQAKYGIAQYSMIKKIVRDIILLQVEENSNICPKEWESRITNAVSVWVMEKTKEYQAYLQGVGGSL